MANFCSRLQMISVRGVLLSGLVLGIFAESAQAQNRSNRRSRTTPSAAAPTSGQKSAAAAQRKPAAGPTAKRKAAGTPNATATKAAAGKAPVATAPALPPLDPATMYNLPKTNDPNRLVAYMSQLLDYQPADEKAQEEFAKRGPGALNGAAARILQLEKDTKTDAYRFATNYVLAMQLLEFEKTTGQQRQKMFGQIKTNLASGDIDADDLELAVAFAESLEYVGDLKNAAAVYASFSRVLAASKDPLIVKLAETMAASARRLNLVGKPISVKGKTVTGENFNWAKYRGKVVVIDFWATWCTPCLADMPKLQKLHQTYKKSGLEVVGISLDQDPAQLAAYLKKNPLPWVTLNEGKGVNNPTAEFYGVSQLPTTIIVDARGNVVSLNARGEELEQRLSELLGQAKRSGTSIK